MLRVAGVAFLLILSVSPGVADDDFDGPVQTSAPYVPVELVSGEIRLVGSRTMSAVAAVWADAFQHIHPDVEFTMEFEGSGTALDQVTVDGTTLGLMSRELTEQDRTEFEAAHPDSRLIPVTTGFDALAVVVHPDNPIEGLTLSQLASIYGQSDADETVSTWEAFDLGEEWDEVPIHRFVTGEQSGSRDHFQVTVMSEGVEYAETTGYHWHAQIVEEVAADRGAIGFVSLANSRSEEVRIVPLSHDAHEPAVLPTHAEIAEDDYPLIRPLTVVVATGEAGPTDPLVIEFLQYLLSQNGQDDLIKDGFQPLGRADVLEQYDRLGWNTIK